MAALCELITARRIIENGELIIIFRQLFIDVIYSQSGLLTRRLIIAARMRSGRLGCCHVAPAPGPHRPGPELDSYGINMSYTHFMT